MPIRRRLVTSDPVAFNQDKALRIALRYGAQALRGERANAEQFPEDYTDAQLMELDRQIAFLERQQLVEGALSLATK